jgi:hypothetical protein
MKIAVKTSGPLFDGRAGREISAFLDEAKEQVGAQALAEVHLILDREIRHPTPYYETQIISERQGNDRVVHDRGIVYGPWLEGTSSRNRTTRFKGYAAFRRASAEVAGRVPVLVEHVLRKYLARLG